MLLGGVIQYLYNFFSQYFSLLCSYSSLSSFPITVCNQDTWTSSVILNSGDECQQFGLFRPPIAMHMRDTEALAANRRFLQYFTVLFRMKRLPYSCCMRFRVIWMIRLESCFLHNHIHIHTHQYTHHLPYHTASFKSVLPSFRVLICLRVQKQTKIYQTPAQPHLPACTSQNSTQQTHSNGV